MCKIDQRKKEAVHDPVYLFLPSHPNYWVKYLFHLSDKGKKGASRIQVKAERGPEG
jgi:hypothetical protein